MKNIDVIISSLVQDQFPEFYREEGPRFLDFVKQYYVWMEQQNQVTNASRSLLSTKDVDTTADGFLSYLKQKYLHGIPSNLSADKRLLIKHATDLHRSKGTSQGVQTTLQAFFNEESVVKYPKNNIIKSSHGKWVKPEYLELTISPRTSSYISKQVKGTSSGAMAFVESLVKRRVGTKYIQVAYLSNVQGDFITGEQVVPISNTVTTDAPFVTGSLTRLDIVTGGANFAVGDTLEVVGSGKQGRARVVAISNETGKVTFTLEDSGWGYSIDNTQVVISEKVLNRNTSKHVFDYYVEQVNPGMSSISVGDIIENYYSNGDVAANGTVLTVTASNTTAGIVAIETNSGNLIAEDSTLRVQGNTVSLLVDTVDRRDFIRFETVTQSLANVPYDTATPNNALFVVGAYLENYHANGDVAALAQVVEASSTNSTAGYVVVKPITSTLVTVDTTFAVQGNGATAVAVGYDDRTVTANITGSNTLSFGAHNITRPFIASAYAPVIGELSNSMAYVSSISTGTGSDFRIATINNTESVFLSPDFLSSNNTEDVVFHSINLNGNNSGAALQYGSPELLDSGDTAYGGFGFVKYPGSNMDSILLDCLRFDATTIGSVAAITGLVTGQGYNADPFVALIQPDVAGYGKRDYVMTITGTSGAFIAGETIQQSISTPAILLSYNNFSGTAANGSASSTLLAGEYVYQSNATANVAASGFVQEAATSTGVGSATLVNVTGTFQDGTAYPLVGLSSGSTANITATSVTTVATVARAIVKAAPIPTTSQLYLKRINLENTFSSGGTIIGRTSGATATINQIIIDDTTIPVGLNAIVSANVQTANAVATSLAVQDSGFGYVEDEQVNLVKLGHPYEITAQVNLGKHGVGEGYFTSTDGFLDSDKKIHDNDYYQDFSYEVWTKIPFNLYVDVLKKVSHVAGTKPFGKVVTVSTANVEMSVLNSIEQTNS